MKDPVVALLKVATFALAHAKTAATGNTKAAISIALSACGEALDLQEGEA